MALLTLAEVKTGPVGRSCGIATTSPNFVNIVNDAVRQLMERGNWYGSLQPMGLNVTTVNNVPTVICPREVQSIMAIRPSNCPYWTPIRNVNLWYEYLPWNDGMYDWLNSCRGRGYERAVESIGYVTVQNQFASPNYIRVTSSIPLPDVGQTITFVGTDQNGAPLTQTITLANPYASSYPQLWGNVVRVSKSLTAGYVNCQQDDNNGNLLPLAVYQPSETSPQYIVLKLLMFLYPPPTVQALVRLSFVPALNDTDLVLIESQDAIRDMVLSIRKKEAGDYQAAATLESSAMRELNHQMRTRFPNEQFQVSFLPFGNDPALRSQHLGMI